MDSLLCMLYTWIDQLASLGLQIELDYPISRKSVCTQAKQMYQKKKKMPTSLNLVLWSENSTKTGVENHNYII